MVERRHEHEHRYRRLHVDDHNHGGNDINDHYDPAGRDDHHGDPAAHDDSAEHDAAGDDHVLVRRTDLDNLARQFDIYIDDPDRPHLIVAAARTLIDDVAAGDDHINHLVASREQHDDVPTVDLNDTINHYRDVIGDDDHPVDPADYLAAVRAIYDAAARVLGTDAATDKPASDLDPALYAYLVERARYDAGISDNATIFGPLRDAARAVIASHRG